MYIIKKVRSLSPIDYAAEELRKYLRMMMLESGNIDIVYDPEAKDGFRLGLMQDFGLDVSDAENIELDDIIYIDTDENGGIIAGDNPRSVLLAVYEYLRQNGCRWLMPGVDGEYIPLQDIVPVKFRHKPSCRFRGQCNEGAEYQSNMIEAIEFTPKLGMNVFMIEHFNPMSYYKQYYEHDYNKNRTPEPVGDNQVIQWKRQCEAEISKRGLLLHDIGHGWTSWPFGIDPGIKGTEEEKNAMVPEENKQYLAMVNGERLLFHGVPFNTQICMSNKTARKMVADFVADYAEKHTNSDYIHVWLADGYNNHCECEECKKMIPSDFYVMLLNDIDEELTRRKLNTRIVYIAYTETMWAPKVEKLKNTDRFALLFAPISREYSYSLRLSEGDVEITPFVRNKNSLPTNFEELYACLEEWMKAGETPRIAYEYHFWRHQAHDAAGISLAKVINGDIKSYLDYNISGVIEDGSQRSFFPTGLAFYTYGRTLFDASLTADEIIEEYFSAAFGDDWRMFYDYLDKLGRAFGHDYLSGDRFRHSDDRSEWYAPEHVESLNEVGKILALGRELIKSHYNSDVRVRTVSVRLLEFHALYAELLAEVFKKKAVGDDDGAYKLYEELLLECGKYELAFERYFDPAIYGYALYRILKTKTNVKSDVVIQ